MNASVSFLCAGCGLHSISNLSYCRLSYMTVSVLRPEAKGMGYGPSKTSLNCANRAPGRAPVETRDDMLPRVRGRGLEEWRIKELWDQSGRLVVVYEARGCRQWRLSKRRNGWCLSGHQMTRLGLNPPRKDLGPYWV